MSEGACYENTFHIKVQLEASNVEVQKLQEIVQRVMEQIMLDIKEGIGCEMVEISETTDGNCADCSVEVTKKMN